MLGSLRLLSRTSVSIWPSFLAQDMDRRARLEGEESQQGELSKKEMMLISLPCPCRSCTAEPKDVVIKVTGTSIPLSSLSPRQIAGWILRKQRSKNRPSFFSASSAPLFLSLGTTICGSDLHLYHSEIVTMQKGDILGHELFVLLSGPDRSILVVLTTMCSHLCSCFAVFFFWGGGDDGVV
jgi:hypothetical protein